MKTATIRIKSCGPTREPVRIEYEGPEYMRTLLCFSYNSDSIEIESQDVGGNNEIWKKDSDTVFVPHNKHGTLHLNPIRTITFVC